MRDIGGVLTSSMGEEGTVVTWPFYCLLRLFSAFSPPHLTYFLLSASGFVLAFNA